MKLNLGCGDRHFGADWVNVDVLYRPPNLVPDIVCDLKALAIGYDTADMIHLGHCIEHFGLGECNALLRECHRILKPGDRSSSLCLTSVLWRSDGSWGRSTGSPTV